MRLRHLASALALMTFPLAACGDDDGATGDTTSTSDTADTSTLDAADATPTGPNWSCLPVTQRPGPSTSELAFPLLVRHALDATPVPGVSIKVCPGTDLACPTPTTTATTATDGTASVTLPMGESGYVGFAILQKDGYIETLAMANVPIVTPRTEPVKLDLLRTSEATGVLAILGADDATRGQLVIGAWDCRLQPASGVRLALTESDEDTKPFYLDGTTPDPTATETDERGGAGFANVAPGTVHVTTTRASDGAAIGTATAQVVAGKITIVVMVPN